MILSTLLYDLKIVFCVFFVAVMFLPSLALKYFVYFDDVVHSVQHSETLKLEEKKIVEVSLQCERFEKVLRKAFRPLEENPLEQLTDHS